MFKNPSQSDLENQLKDIDEELSSHPFSNTRVEEANSLVESMKGKDKEEIDRTLKDRDLPGLEELGKVTATGTYSWWKLHRSRAKILKKLEHI
ncbi:MULTISPECIES: hypothetical protein [Bacteria]|uniref:Uncharacterized protein n=2 Tax=Brevibacterium TaxID=1696 RepID=A0A2H1IQ95_BREAU|nr:MULTISPECIES: hypothetical protein [Bacteria]RCS83689.1 hypothetical protein CIK63_18505 [Brevibacterium aurantiacum]GEB23228.1 hypothetical protein BAU01nite_19610 [Brevibacterium aurantiacum]SMX77389.1 hypothetical protein BAUR9175_01619 [Brevibacterium aurantiacum]SMY02867.1 hypothetical protein BANT10_03451 [Brevibacterium antiquum]